MKINLLLNSYNGSITSSWLLSAPKLARCYSDKFLPNNVHTQGLFAQSLLHKRTSAPFTAVAPDFNCFTLPFCWYSSCRLGFSKRLEIFTENPKQKPLVVIIREFYFCHSVEDPPHTKSTKFPLMTSQARVCNFSDFRSFRA